MNLKVGRLTGFAHFEQNSSISWFNLDNNVNTPQFPPTATLETAHISLVHVRVSPGISFYALAPCFGIFKLGMSCSLHGQPLCMVWSTLGTNDLGLFKTRGELGTRVSETLSAGS